VIVDWFDADEIRSCAIASAMSGHDRSTGEVSLITRRSGAVRGPPVTVVRYEGTRVRLAGEGGGAQAALLAHLLASPGFEVLDAAVPVSRVKPAELDRRASR
jgi:hypothetical protein